MSELSFLIELLLNHDLPKPTKDLIASRIKDVEVNLVSPLHNYNFQHNQYPGQVNPIKGPTAQAPSTLALMAKHGDLPPIVMPEMPPVIPVEQVAQTPATAQAMNSRASAIAASIAGKTDKNTGRPRKW